MADMEDQVLALLGQDLDAWYRNLRLMEDTDPKKALGLDFLGQLSQFRADRLGEASDFDREIAAYGDAVRLTPDGHPNKPDRLYNLGNAFMRRFGRLGEIADLDRAVSAHENTVRLIPDGHPYKLPGTNNVGHSFLTRFERLGETADLDKAISALDKAVRLTPDSHTHKPSCLNALGYALSVRFERLGDTTDLNKAVSAQDDAVKLTPDGHPDMPIRLNSLGTSLYMRFEHLGEIADLDKAASALVDVVRLTPEGHPDKHGLLNNLGNALSARFEHLGDIADLGKAISAQDDAILLMPDGHPDMPNCLNNLGTSLRLRFERLGEIADLNKAISAQVDALRLNPPSHTDKPIYLSNLSNLLRQRFEHLGEITDIDKAVSAQGDAVRLTPDSHPNKPSYLNDLGCAFSARFKRLGDITDLDKAVSIQDDAVRLAPDGHPRKPRYMSSLGSSLRVRFERLGDLADLEKAVSAQDDARRLIPDSHPDKPAYLNSLGISLRLRFERLGEIQDIHRAVLFQEDAVQLTPDTHIYKPSRLDGLGCSLLDRFERLGEIPDLDRAVLALDDALRLTPDGDATKHTRLNHLGLSLEKRFGRLGVIADLNKAILVAEDAVRLIPDDHFDMPAYRHNLGNSFLTRFKRFGEIVDLDNAIRHFSCAALSSTGSVAPRFHAALMWARCASLNGNTSRLNAYRQALELLPRIAWLGLPIVARHRELAEIGHVASDAAAAAIALKEYETAIEWLEEGRSIVWGQLLHLRTPVDDLRAVNADLADRLAQVSVLLERASTQDIDVQPAHQLLLEQAGRNRRALALEWDELVKTARAVPGFEDFLRPKKMSQLRSAARSGPVVVINIHEDRCDALVLMSGPDKVIHVPLKHLSHARVQKLQHSLNGLLSSAGVRGERGTTQSSHYVQGAFRNILWRLWACVVRPVLEALAFPVSRIPELPSRERPRIWWCSTGPLTFLPLHAAGFYQANGVGPSVTDFVISSYTPTLTALLDKAHATRLPNFQLLAITQPSTPGQSPLPATEEELIKIQKYTEKHCLVTLQGSEATVERVMQGMNESSWIHLACHGGQDTANPTKSALFLQDGRLELSKIIEMSLPHADFAFLSACQTATGHEDLTEESVHLAAGMLLAGYHGVIATSWSIKDNDAPLVADEVYSRLFKDGQPDRTRAADALHHAVELLREQGAPFLSWVPFIHFGM